MVKKAVAALILVLIVIAIALGAYYCSRPGVFPIKSVQVQGDYQFVTKQAIAETVTPFVGNGFFHVAVVPAQNALDNLPGIKRATIRRIWPSTVQVTLVEQTTIGRWLDGRLLTDQGMLFTPVSPGLGGTLPLFIGPEADVGMMAERYAELQPILKNAPFSIKSYVYQADTGWTLTTQDDVSILLGDAHVAERLARLVAAYPQLLASNPKQALNYVDMQYKNGFAANWKVKVKPISVIKPGVKKSK